ncbi:Hypothetical_protein [Hexamita inflata]|uniref:Hypothetical_protein n=1 Tax=Hexamita inflata TaxID=28002 RepID=A0AA86U607_9EUKA|nr:Hypothetical protein HINF_LOCUS28336 [Hexamita inflata]
MVSTAGQVYPAFVSAFISQASSISVYANASIMNFNDTASEALQKQKFSRYISLSRSRERFKVGLLIHFHNVVSGRELKSRYSRNVQFHPRVGIYVDAAARSCGGFGLEFSKEVLFSIRGQSGELQFSSRCYSYVIGVGMVKYCRLSKIATTPNLVNRLLSPIASALVSLTDFSFDIMRLLKNLTYFTFKYYQQINNNLAILNKQISTSHEH